MKEVRYLADVRYSVAVPANSSAAVKVATEELGLGAVLLEPMYDGAGDDPSEAGIFFGPVTCPEMVQLRTMPVMEWLTTVSRLHELPRVDSLDDMLALEGVEELWLWVGPQREQIEGILTILRNEFPEEQRIVLVADFELSEDVPYRCADPTGNHEFFFCEGDFGDWLRNQSKWKQSVALRGDGFSNIRIKTVL